MVSDWASGARPTGQMAVCCEDCGLHWHFRMKARLPRWLKRLIEARDAYNQKETSG